MTQVRAVVGSDGLPALEVGSWTADKLAFLSKYIHLFNQGMKNRWQVRVYIDLFAGPGMNISRPGATETDGSPLIALKSQVPFTHCFFNDLNPQFLAALRARAQTVLNAGKPGTHKRMSASSASNSSRLGGPDASRDQNACSVRESKPCSLRNGRHPRFQPLASVHPGFQKTHLGGPSQGPDALHQKGAQAVTGRKPPRSRQTLAPATTCTFLLFSAIRRAVSAALTTSPGCMAG